MNTVPTREQLEGLGVDAGAFLDACESELERAIAMVANKADRPALADDLKQVRALRAEWFGEGA